MDTVPQERLGSLEGKEERRRQTRDYARIGTLRGPMVPPHRSHLRGFSGRKKNRVTNRGEAGLGLSWPVFRPGPPSSRGGGAKIGQRFASKSFGKFRARRGGRGGGGGGGGGGTTGKKFPGAVKGSPALSRGGRARRPAPPPPLRGGPPLPGIRRARGAPLARGRAVAPSRRHRGNVRAPIPVSYKPRGLLTGPPLRDTSV